MYHLPLFEMNLRHLSDDARTERHDVTADLSVVCAYVRKCVPASVNRTGDDHENCENACQSLYFSHQSGALPMGRVEEICGRPGLLLVKPIHFVNFVLHVRHFISLPDMSHSWCVRFPAHAPARAWLDCGCRDW